MDHVSHHESHVTWPFLSHDPFGKKGIVQLAQNDGKLVGNYRLGLPKIEGIPIKFGWFKGYRDTIKFGYNFWLDLDPFWSMSQSCCVNLSQPLCRLVALGFLSLPGLSGIMGPWTGTFLLANNEPTTGLHHPPILSESYCSVFECICYLNLFDDSVVSSIFKYFSSSPIKIPGEIHGFWTRHTSNRWSVDRDALRLRPLGLDSGLAGDVSMASGGLVVESLRHIRVFLK